MSGGSLATNILFWCNISMIGNSQSIVDVLLVEILTQKLTKKCWFEGLGDARGTDDQNYTLINNLGPISHLFGVLKFTTPAGNYDRIQ
jgi:hypothetical protein